MKSVSKTLLKNGLLSIGFILVVLFYSCESDDGTMNENPLVGLWRLSSVALNGEVGELHQCNKQDTIELMADNSFEQISYISDPSESFDVVDCTEDNESTTKGTWATPSSGKLSITYNDGESSVTETSDYTISGNTLTLTFNASLGTVRITYTRI